MTDEAKSTTFKVAARKAAMAWKATSAALPDEARAPGRYRQYPSLPFCLPEGFTTHNLLPDARDIALERFEAAGIPWHDGVSGGPSSHLLSSQVQCANALAPFVDDPAALKAMFGDALPICRVLPFGAVEGHGHVSPFDATDHVVFEWQGLDNHLSEWKGKPTRGSQATSADAAIRYEATDGAIELALIEWKYTESYPNGALSTSKTSNATRHARYQPILESEGGPIRTDLIDLDDLLAEPVYQLMRLVLLAHCIEQTHEQGVDRARVLYVAPSANTALWASPCSAGFAARAGGDSYHDAWPRFLTRPDRMVFMDSRSLVADASPQSDEFKTRYRPIGD